MPSKKNNRRAKNLKRKFQTLWRRSLERFLPTRDQFRHLPKLLSGGERLAVLVLCIIALGGLVAAPISAYYHFTVETPDYGGSFTEGMVGAPKYVNPLLAQTSDVDRDLSKIIYAGLMKYDNQGNLSYDLTESYEISGDGLTYTFKLKDNLKWHDGHLITADDVVFTILIAQNPDYGSFQRINWQGVEVSKTDNQTIIFKLKNKYAQFLTNTTLGILPKHLWENVKPSSFGLSELNLKAIGSGPYKFSKLRRDTSGNISSIELIAFPEYHRGRPYITKVTFKFYASEDKMINAFNENDIDGFSFISPQKKNSIRFAGKLNIRELKLPRYFAAFFNQNNNNPVSDKNVRLALNYATDKKRILDSTLSGNGIIVDSPMLPGIIDVADSPVKFSFDPEKAKKILDEAGWAVPADAGVRQKIQPPAKKGATPPPPVNLEIKLTTSNWPELVTVANQLKQQWESIGTLVSVEVLTLPELQQAIKDREYEVLLFGEVLGLDPDPFSFWHSSQKRDPGLNLALYDNKEADKILEEARQIHDPAARLKKYEDFQKILINDAPVVFLYSPNYLYAQPRKIYADGIEVISVPSDRFDTISQWYIDTARSFKAK